MKKSFSGVQFKESDGQIGAVTACIATLGKVDKDGDVLAPGSVQPHDVIMSAWQHASWEGAAPIGRGSVKIVGEEVIFDGQFFTDSTAGADAYHTVKGLQGLSEWSFSLQNIVREPITVDGKKASLIKSFDMKEVSPVLVGASVNTRTLAIKSSDMKFSEHKEAVLTALAVLAERATEVVTLRAEQNKSFSWANDLHDQIVSQAALLKSCIDKHTTPSDEDEAALQREYLRFVALTQGV